MKTLKKIFPFFVLLCFFGGIVSSCKDDSDECCCNPKINYIIPSDAAAKDSIIAGANSGEHIIIVGENLASVTEVFFDNVPADLNPVYITDNYIILQIPDINVSTQCITLVNAQGCRVQAANFAINIPPPVVGMFYSEFVPAGGILRVKGNYFFSPNVYFYDENDNLIKADKVGTKGSTELFVTVPNGVGNSKPIVVETGSGKTTSKILFRDRRNIIIDFDEYHPTVEGTMVRGGTGAPDYRPKWREDVVEGFDLRTLLPAGFELPEGCDGLYDQMNRIEFKDGGYIAYQVEKGGRDMVPLIGDFASYDIKELVLKFEVYVPKDYAINGIYTCVCFPPKGNNGSNAGGRGLSNKEEDTCVPGAWWCPFEADINKSNPDSWLWTVGVNCKTSFYTDWQELEYSGKWMTVSIPLSTFKWNLVDMGINTTMEKNFADYEGSPCLAKKQILEKDWTKAMGDFTFMWEPWAASGQDGVFLCFLDNFRVVPDDGGGVQFGKVGQRASNEGGRPY